jgi:hypothetical protein
MGEMGNAYIILVGRCRCRWEGIRRNLRGIRWEGVDWMHLGQGRDQWRGLLNMVMNLHFQ